MCLNTHGQMPTPTCPTSVYMQFFSCLMCSRICCARGRRLLRSSLVGCCVKGCVQPCILQLIPQTSELVACTEGMSRSHAGDDALASPCRSDRNDASLTLHRPIEETVLYYTPASASPLKCNCCCYHLLNSVNLQRWKSGPCNLIANNIYVAQSRR